MKEARNRVIPPFLGWYLSLLGKAAATNMGRLLVIVAAYLAAQTSMLLAFLLPLKVVILLGSNGIPAYFPAVLKAYARDDLIIGLSVCAGVFYLAGTLFGRFGTMQIDRLANDVLDREPDFVSTSSQMELTRRTIEDVAHSLSGASFAVLALCALVVLYPRLSLVVLSTLAFAALILIPLSRASETFGHYLEEHPDLVSRTFFGVSFLTCFVFIVSDFLIPLSPPTLVYALVSLILARQLFAGASVVFNRVLALKMRAGTVSSVLSLEHTDQSKAHRRERRFWELLSQPSRSRWMQSVYGSDAIADGGSSWLEGGLTGIGLIAVPGEPGGGGLLVKLFGDPRRHYGEREAILLRECRELAIAPLLLHESELEGFRCHVYEWGEFQRVPRADRAGCRRDAMKSLMAVAPSRTLVESYARANPSLPDRLRKMDLSRLQAAASTSSANALIAILEQRLQGLADAISRMPVQVSRSSPLDSDLFRSSTGEIKIIGWGDWIVEPIGVGWSTGSEEDTQLLEAYDSARSVRSDCDRTPGEMILLARELSEFERHYRNQNLSRALGTLVGLSERCDDVYAGDRSA